MANHAENNLSYWIELNIKQEEDLGTIRHWDNLKVGFENQSIWLKGFTVEQINSVTLKSIPFIKRYYAQEGKLFRFNSRLPQQNIPSVLWTPIERGLQVTLPKMNFNYFGMDEKIKIKLVESEIEKPIISMLTSLERLSAYIYTAPEIRLEQLKWCIINSQKILLIGAPLLPIQGDALWRRGDFLIPAGFDFDQYLLTDILNEKINTNNSWVLWNRDSNYFLIDKNALMPLSIASFRDSA